MSKKSYDLYGIECDSLNDAKEIIEHLLNIVLNLHESGYHCGEYYRLYDVGLEHFILQNNYDEFEGEWTEETHSDYKFLFYVNETFRPDEIRNNLSIDKRIMPLRHQEF